MGNKVNYIQTINFITLFHTPQDHGTKKSETESRKMGLRFFPTNFHGCVSLILS